MLVISTRMHFNTHSHTYTGAYKRTSNLKKTQKNARFSGKIKQNFLKQGTSFDFQ